MVNGIGLRALEDMHGFHKQEEENIFR